jgi:hypothetical protein
MTTRTPIPLDLSEAELMLGEALGQERGMLELVHRCPECQSFVLVCDNNVWLDAVPLEPGHNDACAMGVMKLGELRLAAGGNIDGGSPHSLHSHQPPEEG